VIASRRKILTLIVVLPALSGCAHRANGNARTLRIGYQKWGTFSILKASGKLAEAFRSQGIRLEWIEFPAGPPLFEALNAGSIDLGHAGDSPPLFAQAANIPFVYFAVSSSSPESSGILVKNESSIHRAADLQGRRIGFAKGTSGHTLVLLYLEKNGMTFSDVTPIYLPPADGRAALESGAIDAWSIWDPYFAMTQQIGGYRPLTSGKGFVDGREFYFASRHIMDTQPQLVRDFRAELESVKTWAMRHTADVNRFLAADTGIPVSAVSLAESRRNRYQTQSLTPDVIASQQSLADRYFKLGLLPKQIDVKADVLNVTPDGGN
jgi:sulfonate transport system substrate-binding protein